MLILTACFRACQDFLDLPHAASSATGPPSRSWCGRDTAILRGEDTPAACAASAACRPARRRYSWASPALVARLHGPDVVEDHAVDVEHLLVVLDLVGVLEEVAHHPGVGQDGVEPLHGFGRGSSALPSAGGGSGCRRAATAGAVLAGAAASATRPLPWRRAPGPLRPRPARCRPRASSPASSKPKWKGSPALRVPDHADQHVDDRGQAEDQRSDEHLDR